MAYGGRLTPSYFEGNGQRDARSLNHRPQWGGIDDERISEEEACLLIDFDIGVGTSKRVS